MARCSAYGFRSAIKRSWRITLAADTVSTQRGKKVLDGVYFKELSSSPLANAEYKHFLRTVIDNATASLGEMPADAAKKDRDKMRISTLIASLPELPDSTKPMQDTMSSFRELICSTSELIRRGPARYALASETAEGELLEKKACLEAAAGFLFDCYGLCGLKDRAKIVHEHDLSDETGNAQKPDSEEPEDTISARSVTESKILDDLLADLFDVLFPLWQLLYKLSTEGDF
ncbi:MAG: hypothetical protein Q9184_002602 [Pyrenodesmia sp. 2 TL-2023]